jgi:AcrR family transcriptional regulator
MTLQRQRGPHDTEPELDKRPPGTPRSPECHEAILHAALTLLEEVGFAALTMEGIAARAECGKTTIYRRWPNKASVVMDAFLASTTPEVEFRDTGSVREDFRRQLRSVVRVLTGPRGRLISALIASGQMDAELGEAYLARWQTIQRTEARQALERGIARGELSKEADLELMLDALYGPLYYRLLIKHAPLTQSYADALVELVFAGLEARANALKWKISAESNS